MPTSSASNSEGSEQVGALPGAEAQAESEQTESAPSKAEPPECTWAEFFLETPPMSRRRVTVGRKRDFWGGYGKRQGHHLPVLEQFCGHPRCQGVRRFESSDEPLSLKGERRHFLIVYRCQNCKEWTKEYSFYLSLAPGSETVAHGLKLGEHPAFGQRLPTRAMTMIGPDMDLFQKGYRAETQGMGIGAYAYYRRVVEAQWRRILREIVKVAKATNAKDEVLERLQEAIADDNFTQSAEKAAGALPAALFVAGDNPLRLLYAAVSKGIHELDEDECLSRAHNIRVILLAMGRHTAEIIDEKEELTAAIKSLRESLGSEALGSDTGAP